MDTELWLELIHTRNLFARDLNRFLQNRAPGKSLMDLGADETSAFLTDIRHTLSPADRKAVATDIRWLDGGTNRHLLPISDPRYPCLLQEIPDPPLALFVVGNLDCLDSPCLSIVGSRNSTPPGRETATSLARSLAALGFVVASGLAQGIDGCAHRGALETGTTIGVCAHGLDTVYPFAHRKLAAAICEQGALISEFPTRTPPRRHHFPQRNRIISGLSLGTLVVEANLRSGSLITARLAAEQNREVFAVPGSIHSPLSRGCHELIKNGAALVECLEDILGEFDHYGRRATPAGPSGTPESKNPHAWFLDHMGYAPCTRDDLVTRSGLTSAEVSSMLLALELDGCVELCPGGTYVRVTRS